MTNMRFIKVIDKLKREGILKMNKKNEKAL